MLFIEIVQAVSVVFESYKNKLLRWTIANYCITQTGLMHYC